MVLVVLVLVLLVLVVVVIGGMSGNMESHIMTLTVYNDFEQIHVRKIIF